MDPTDSYIIEITKVLTVFPYAVTRHLGVVSFLETLSDSHRAKDASIAVDAPYKKKKKIQLAGESARVTRSDTQPFLHPLGFRLGLGGQIEY